MLQGCTPWPQELALTYRAKGYWEDRSIPALLDDMTAEAPDRVAVIDGDARATLRDIRTESERLAAHFHRLGLNRLRKIVQV